MGEGVGGVCTYRSAALAAQCPHQPRAGAILCVPPPQLPKRIGPPREHFPRVCQRHSVRVPARARAHAVGVTPTP